MTCAHVVAAEPIGSENIIIEWDGQTWTGVLRTMSPLPCPADPIFPDLAVIEVLKSGGVDPIDHNPCALLDERCEVGDPLFAFGFSHGRPGGDSMKGECEGTSQYGPSADQKLIKVAGTQIKPGASGAPVLNLRTGRICGMIKRTRDETSDLGGYAVRIPTIFAYFPKLRDENAAYHDVHPNWRSSVVRDGKNISSGDPNSASDKRPRSESLQSLLDALPVTTRKLFGREDELAWLDECYGTNAISVVVLHAFGGVGKTAVVRSWVESRLGGSTGSLYFIGCSFYSQGTRERAGTSDQFFYDSLRELGDPEPTKGTLWARARRLAKLLSHRPSILVLDGLEPLQFGPGETEVEGQLKDPGIRELLAVLAEGRQKTFCIVTSRLPVSDDFVNGAVVQRSLDLLPLTAAEELLRSKGVHGTPTSLRRVADYFGRHSLALGLAAEYLTTYCEADADRAYDIPLLNEDTKAGRHAKSVMRAYEAAFIRENNVSDLRVLYLLGLFDRPAKWAWLKVLCDTPIAGLTDLSPLTEVTLAASLQRLSRLGLLADTYRDGKLDTHPLIAEYFGMRFKQDNQDAWQQANDRLFSYLAATSAQNPAGLEELEPLLLAVVHGCKAGRYSQALHTVFIPRIMKFDEAYASVRLGLVGPVLTVLAHFFHNRNWTTPCVATASNPGGLMPEDCLYVLTQVGFLLTASKGYATPDLRPIYELAITTSEGINNRNALFEITYGLWKFHSGRGDLSSSMQRANELLVLSDLTANGIFKVAAHRALATSLYRTGHFERAFAEAVAGISERQLVFPAYFGDDPTINCECFASLALWHLGNVEQCLARQSDAIGHARERADAHGLAVALYLAAYPFDFTHNHSKARQHSTWMIELSAEHGFRWWLAAGMIRHGWADAMLGSVEEGLDEVDRGIALWRSSRASIGIPYWSSLRADVMRKAGNRSLALESLEEGLVAMNETGERWWEPELHRQKGEILLDDGIREGDAVNSFKKAINTARLHGDVSLELRASASLNRYIQASGYDSAAT